VAHLTPNTYGLGSTGNSSGAEDCSDKAPQVVDTVEFQALAVPEPETLAALYADGGLSTRQVAAAQGCGRSTVQQALARASVSPRTRRKHAADALPSTYLRTRVVSEGQPYSHVCQSSVKTAP